MQVFENANETLLRDGFDIDGARLIAPSITCEGKIKEKASGFQCALNGEYPLSNPVLDLENLAVYSLDMVRLDFYHDSQQKIIDVIDKQPIFATVESFTSNRIGTYRFMWAFRYANGEHGGYELIIDGETVIDGDKDVVLKVGYGVVKQGGKTSNKGFVEFNPNKCENNGRKFIDLLYDAGCIFELRRFDVAIDYSIQRNRVRLIRDRRKYEYVLSSKGGATEYLGQRNAPGRVKVYDKAGEQGLEADLTRVELTADAKWTIKEISDHLPICNSYYHFKGDGVLLALCTIIGDLLLDVDSRGKPTTRSLSVVPERYLQMLHKNTRYKLKKALKQNDLLLKYKDAAIALIVERANSFVIN